MIVKIKINRAGLQPDGTWLAFDLSKTPPNRGQRPAHPHCTALDSLTLKVAKLLVNIIQIRIAGGP